MNKGATRKGRNEQLRELGKNSDVIFDDGQRWHGCISEYLFALVAPVAWNDGIPSWALRDLKTNEYLPINYCPVCGEKLPPVGNTALKGEKNARLDQCQE